MWSVYEDAELYDWLRWADQYGGSFLQAIAEAALIADLKNYNLLRPALLKLKEDEFRPPTSSVVVEREDEKSHDPSGPRIRCPFCNWSPRKEDK